ncbi:MAG TPA: hypothetical protein VI911_07575 [Patescibacteria group bacterium]|nr:hypothetical protein [Patescibacteria group bacterium]
MENEELKIYDQIKHAFEQYEYAVWLYDDKTKKAAAGCMWETALMQVLKDNVAITHQYWKETEKFLEVFRFHKKYTEAA